MSYDTGEPDDAEVGEKLFTSLAYDDLYSNKPTKLYKIIEDYIIADISNVFGLSIVEFLDLSPIESTILLEIAISTNKVKRETKDAEEEASLKLLNNQ